MTSEIEKRAEDYLLSHIWEFDYRNDRDIKKAFLAGASADRWIPLTSARPDPYKAVLTQAVGELYPAVCFRMDDEWWIEPEGAECSLRHTQQIRPRLVKPTHWQPLPEPPTEGEKAK